MIPPQTRYQAADPSSLNQAPSSTLYNAPIAPLQSLYEAPSPPEPLGLYQAPVDESVAPAMMPMDALGCTLQFQIRR